MEVEANGKSKHTPAKMLMAKDIVSAANDVDHAQATKNFKTGTLPPPSAENLIPSFINSITTNQELVDFIEKYGTNAEKRNLPKKQTAALRNRLRKIFSKTSPTSLKDVCKYLALILMIFEYTFLYHAAAILRF